MPCRKHPPTPRPHVSKQIVKSHPQFWISKKLLIEIIPYYYCHDLLVLVSVSPESAVPSYKSKIPLQSNPFILFPSSILTIRRWWRMRRLISRSDWPFNAVFLIVRAMKSFFGLDLNNWSKINGEWSNYRQLWSKDSHWRRQMRRRPNKLINAPKSRN